MTFSELYKTLLVVPLVFALLFGLLIGTILFPSGTRVDAQSVEIAGPVGIIPSFPAPMYGAGYNAAMGRTIYYPTGGRIVHAMICLCSLSIYMVIGPPVPSSVVFQLGFSQLYGFGQIYRTGPWALGDYTLGGACVIYIPPSACATYGYPIGTFSKVGTSLI